tara:strand:- start:48 stop:755 length:708 start_codon:yes stop_codon:yes gene_type:complete
MKKVFRKIKNFLKHLIVFKSFRASSEQYWEKTASNYREHYNNEFPGRLENQMKIIKKNLNKLKKSDKVLDLACADGFVSEFLSSYVDQVVGIDISKNAIKNAKINSKKKHIKNTKYYVRNLMEKNEIGESYNHIFCLGLFTCIENNDNFNDILKICNNSLLENGYLFLKDTIHYGSKDIKIHNNYVGSYYRTRQNYFSILENHFQIIETDSIEKKYFLEDFQSDFESIFIVAKKK